MARGVFVAATTLTAAALNDCFNPPRCRVSNSAAISHTTSGTAQVLTFDTELLDSGGMHSTSVNTGRITVPTGGGGMYVISATASFAANATGFRSLQIRVNGVTTIAQQMPMCVTTAATQTHVNVSTMYPLAAGDYLEVLANQNSGGALNINANSDWSPTFMACWVAVS